MKILFVEPYTVNIPHWGTCLELMEEHLLKGDEIYFGGCYSDLSACDVNPDIDLKKCLMCIDREYEGISKLTDHPRIQKIKMSQLITKKEKEMLRAEHSFESLQDLKNLSYKEFHDLGYAVLSSLISWRQDAFPDVQKDRGVLNRLIYSSKLVYEYVLKLVDHIQPDQVYVYNGRHAIVRAAFRAGKAKGVKVSLHEVGSDLSKFLVDHNSLLHEIPAVRKRIHEFWKDQNVDEDTRLQRAKEFFEQRRQGVIKGWFSFTKDQKQVLPPDWNESQRNVVVFTSSEDEFAAIGD